MKFARNYSEKQCQKRVWPPSFWRHSIQLRIVYSIQLPHSRQESFVNHALEQSPVVSFTQEAFNITHIDRNWYCIDMLPRRKLTDFDRARAIAWLQAGMSVRQVAQRLAVSHSVIVRLGRRSTKLSCVWKLHGIPLKGRRSHSLLTLFLRVIFLWISFLRISEFKIM